MTTLNNKLAIVSRTGKSATLVAIDLDSKTCIIENGVEKTVTFTTAAGYRLGTGTPSQTKPLSETLLTNIATEDLKAKAEELQKKTEATKEESKPATEDTLEGKDPESDENIPTGLLATAKPDAENDKLFYIEDLSTATGYKSKTLRKKLRKLAEGTDKNEGIVKNAHTWCFDQHTFDALVDLLKVEAPASTKQ